MDNYFQYSKPRHLVKYMLQKHTEETKNKISETNKGSKLSGRKSVDENPKIQEEYIKIYFLRYYQYYSWLELMQEFGCSRKKIERALKWVEKRFLELPPKSLLSGAIFAIERRLKAHTAIWEKEVKRKRNRSIRNIVELNREIREDSKHLQNLQSIYQEHYVVDTRGGNLSAAQILKLIQKGKEK